MKNKKDKELVFKYVAFIQGYRNEYYRRLKRAENYIKKHANGRPAFIRIILDENNFIKFNKRENCL